jgi:hypothetical protein
MQRAVASRLADDMSVDDAIAVTLRAEELACGCRGRLQTYASAANLNKQPDLILAYSGPKKCSRQDEHPHDQSSILLPDVIHFRLRNVE